MPKQIWKIDEFHGGLNTNSDPRDINKNELSAANDVMVDEIGKIRLMGGTVAHDAGQSPDVDIESGYGLFHFAHDRVNGHLGEHLSNQEDFSSNWSGGNGWTLDSTGTTDASYSHNDSPADLIQTSANRLEKGVVNVTYAFTYTITGLTGQVDTLRILGGSGQFASDNFTHLNIENGTHTTTFTSNSSTVDSPFTIDVSSQSGAAFNITYVSLYIYDAAQTGDDYLILSDDESDDPAAYIYSKNNDEWSATQMLKMGEDNSFAPCYYSADGALRISDANFGAGNSSKWYGYIVNEWFPDLRKGWKINEWYSTHQELSPPASSYYKKNWTASSGETTNVYSSNRTKAIINTHPHWHHSRKKSEIVTTMNTTGKLRRAVVTYLFYTDTRGTRQYLTTTLRAGFWDDDGEGLTDWNDGQFTSIQNNSGGTRGVWSSIPGAYMDVQIHDNRSFSPRMEHMGTHEFVFDPEVCDMADVLTEGNGDEYFRAEVLSCDRSPASAGAQFSIINITLYEAAEIVFPDLSSDSAAAGFEHGFLNANNVGMLFGWNSSQIGATSAAWVPEEDEGLWSIGATFIYDGNQESKITVLADEENNSILGMNLNNATGWGDLHESDNLIDTNRPAVVLAIADPKHDSQVEGEGGRDWNKRVTGCNIYMRNDYSSGEGSTPNAWNLQYSADFLTGKLRVESSRVEFDASYHATSDKQSYYYWYLPTTHSIAPSSVTTYELNTGYQSTTDEFVDAYKTAVVANRVVYIGNVRVQKADGTVATYGDAMIKSHVNKFDTFPLKRTVEASVRDGDSIVKLEEYADRILQFKKNKMHLINISQELEFLEDTFIHKGVSHPAATCKTDFGIAWVNLFGVYLYDGQKVHNLSEKDGRNVIKWEPNADSNWFDPVDQMMIAYFPKRRQLIVVQDINGNGFEDNDIYLYDMITKSWTKGSYKMPTLQPVWVSGVEKTNMITDWNDDLVIAAGTGTSWNVLKWSDKLGRSTQGTSSKFEIQTGDIDFGEPGRRKKIYKVFVTYKSNGTSNVQCTFSVNGAVNIEKTFSTAELGDTFVTAKRSDGTTSNLLAVAISEDGGSDGFSDIIVDDADVFNVGDILLVDDGSNSEQMRVSQKYSSTLIVVERGFGGTTAQSSHDHAASISVLEWSRQEFVPSNVSDTKNIYSFKLYLKADAAVPSEFEVNDMSIVYRSKAIK